MSCAIAEHDQPVTFPERPGQRQSNLDAAQIHKRILIMDDDALMCDLAHDILKPLGYAVACTYDGAEALAQYTEARQAGCPFDIVLMDLHVLFGMDGRETLAHLRALDPQVKVVALSGDNSQPVLEEVQRCGFDCFLAKPYSLVALRQVVKAILGASQSGQ
jgi:two-component system, cell cycle sensor histidine kinase and response regulator CckA